MNVAKMPYFQSLERDIPLDLFKQKVQNYCAKTNSAMPTDTSHNSRLHTGKTEKNIDKAVT
jgi:hypothetical protein